MSNIDIAEELKYVNLCQKCHELYPDDEYNRECATCGNNNLYEMNVQPKTITLWEEN